jgi:hypothetical protein
MHAQERLTALAPPRPDQYNIMIRTEYELSRHLARGISVTALVHIMQSEWLTAIGGERRAQCRPLPDAAASRHARTSTRNLNDAMLPQLTS